MAGRKPVAGELESYLRKEADLRRQFLEGVLPPREVLGGIQSLIEGKFGEEVVPIIRQKPALIHELFVPPEVQLEGVHRWNEERQWGFDEKDFENLPAPPEWPTDKLVAIVLVPYLATVELTFDKLWQVAASRQKVSWRWPKLLSDPDHLRLLDGIEHRPGLRWEVIDLASNWDRSNGISPESVRDPKTSPHAGILAAAAHHPKWVQVMDGDKVPYVWISGYEVTIARSQLWRGVPYLSFGRSDREVSLSACWCGGRSCCYAVPSFRGSAQS